MALAERRAADTNLILDEYKALTDAHLDDGVGVGNDSGGTGTARQRQRHLAPVVDGRPARRRGSVWTADLFSTRADYTEGILYQSRLQQVRKEAAGAAQRVRNSTLQTNSGATGRRRRRRRRSRSSTSEPSPGRRRRGEWEEENQGSEWDRGHIDTDTDEDSETYENALGDQTRLAQTRRLRLVHSVEVEAQRDYLLALRSAVRNEALHERIVESDFIPTLRKLKQAAAGRAVKMATKNVADKRSAGGLVAPVNDDELHNSDDKSQSTGRGSSIANKLIVSALSSEVLGLLCHSPSENVRVRLLRSGAVSLLLEFAEAAIRNNTQKRRLVAITASALANLSALPRAPRIFAREGVFQVLGGWCRSRPSPAGGGGLSSLHVRACYVNALSNVARSTPRSHTTYWLDALVMAGCDTFIAHDGIDDCHHNGISAASARKVKKRKQQQRRERHRRQQQHAIEQQQHPQAQVGGKTGNSSTTAGKCFRC